MHHSMHVRLCTFVCKSVATVIYYIYTYAATIVYIQLKSWLCTVHAAVHPS